jgi:hypothetical protein
MQWTVLTITFASTPFFEFEWNFTHRALASPPLNIAAVSFSGLSPVVPGADSLSRGKFMRQISANLESSHR